MRIIDLAGIEILPGDYKKLRPERVDELARWMRIKRKKGYLMPPTGFKPIKLRRSPIGYFLVDAYIGLRLRVSLDGRRYRHVS